MNKTYVIDISSQDDIKKFRNDLAKLERKLGSDDFKQYLGKKMEEALRFIQRELLTTIDNDLKEELSNYMNSNHLEINDDTIYIYNDATIDISSKNMKETTKANYPAQLSLAKIVEYGIGYTGALTPHQEENDDWEYDINNHGYKGWYYINDNGETIWTNGYQGRLIFFHLKEFVEKSVGTWIEDYIEKNI